MNEVTPSSEAAKPQGEEGRRVHVLVCEGRGGELHPMARWVWGGDEPVQTEPEGGVLIGQAFLERTVKHLNREGLL